MMPTFLAPAWGWLGLLAIPIILLYILRQRRENTPVSSTILWSKALADLRASTPFQRLRRNLLLLLQLFILAALVFTLMRPVVQAKAPRGTAGIIVIDSTASMQTHDDGADESRLDRAKIEAKKLVDGMRPGDQFMLISDGGGMSPVRSGFTTSKSELYSLIDSVTPTDTASDLSESLQTANTQMHAIGAGASGDRPEGAPETKSDTLSAGKIWLFSDGSGVRLPDTMSVDSGLLEFVRIGSSDHSVGVTRLSITPVAKEAKTYEVFVGLKNAWPVEKRVGILLAYGSPDAYMPDQARFVTLPANTGIPGSGSGSVVFEKVVADPGKLFVRVDDKDDDFPLDNTAYGIIAPPRKTHVLLVTSGDAFLENVVMTAARIGLAESQIIAPEAYDPQMPADLVILDGFLPPADRLPKADTLLVRPQVAVKEGEALDLAGFKVRNVAENPSILTWARENPVMQNISMGDVLVSQALLMDRDSSAVPLVDTAVGPLIAYKDFGPTRRYFISFHPLLESNWWSIPTLIMFMQNVIEQTRERHFIGMPQLMQSGLPARLWDIGDAKGEGKAQIKLPDGSVVELPVKDGSAEFGATDHVGYYEVTPATGGDKKLFAVNLLSSSESDIRPRSLQSANGGNIEEVSSVAAVNKEIWRWLAAGALLVLLAEWWVYHRRVA